MPDNTRDEAIVSDPIDEPFPEVPPEADWGADESHSPGPEPQPDEAFEPVLDAADQPEGTTRDDSDDSKALDPRYKKAFDGLMYLGYLQDEFTFGGHRFVIRTLDADAMLEVALLVKKWQGSMAESRAYSTAVVAASVELLDDKPLHSPLGPGMPDLTERFAIVRKWYPWTIDEVYSRVLDLQAEVDELLAELGKASR